MTNIAYNQQLPTNVLRYGMDQPLSEQIALRAGPFSMVYEAGDLRYIRFGKHEVVRRVYAAVRDHNWGTVPGTLHNVEIKIDSQSFRIAYDAVHQHGAIDWIWHGTITGDTHGTITFTFDGEARASFLRNRVGFCVLHPAACAGAACIVEHVDGSSERASLPTLIVADQPVTPFANMRALGHEVTPGVWATVRFAGDIFEMEDQRNWTDASFKTFCTPLSLPYPVEIAAGTRIQQSITITLRDERSAIHAAAGTTNDQKTPVIVHLPAAQHPAPVRPLPAIGLGIASASALLSEHEIERLRALHIQHLRVDVVPGAGNSEQQIKHAATTAQHVGVPLEVAVLLNDEPDAELQQVRQHVEQIQAPISRWLICPLPQRLKNGAPIDALVRSARAHLASYNPQAQFGAGTNADYIFLLRNLPPLDQVDVLTCAVNPQVHAFDNASLVETLAAQATIVDNMQHIAPDIPPVISPVTLKPRFNPYATGVAPKGTDDELPPQVDVRQMSLFGAAWTLGSLKYLAEAGAASVTFYETTGWCGVMETESGSALPDRFPSLPGAVFPLYHVLADVGEFAGGAVEPTRSGDSLRVESLLLRKNKHTRLLLANMTNDAQQVALPPLGERVQLRVLDETNALQAMQSSQTFRRQTQTVDAGGPWKLTLRPYAVACIDSN